MSSQVDHSVDHDQDASIGHDAIRVEPHLACLASVLNELVNQRTAEHTLHQILDTLRCSLHPMAAAVLLKDHGSDDLTIRSNFNIAELFVNGYRRGIGSGIVGRLMFTQPHVAVSADHAQSDYQELKLNIDYEWAAAARIAVSGRPIGYLVAYWDRQPEDAPATLRLVQGLANASALALQHQEYSDMMNRLQLVDHDSGLLLYPCFCQKLDEELKRCKRYNEPLTVAIMDLDNFKMVLNTYGLEAGRQLYREVVCCLRKCVRESDVLCNFGADEILLYLACTDAVSAQTVLERFAGLVQEQEFTAQKIKTSMTIGFANREETDDAQNLVWRAQRALYEGRVSDSRVVGV